MAGWPTGVVEGSRTEANVVSRHECGVQLVGAEAQLIEHRNLIKPSMVQQATEQGGISDVFAERVGRAGKVTLRVIEADAINRSGHDYNLERLRQGSN